MVLGRNSVNVQVLQVPAGDLLPGKDWMIVYTTDGATVIAVSDAVDVADGVADAWDALNERRARRAVRSAS